MTWHCRHCGHNTVWWKGACELCGVPLKGERKRPFNLGRALVKSFRVASEFEAQMRKVELCIKRVPVLDTGIGQQLGYANDRAFVEAARREREELLADLSPGARARFLEAEAELERRVFWGGGTP